MYPLFLTLFILFWDCLYADPRKIVIITDYTMRGETAFAYRLKAACHRLQWEAEVCSPSQAYKNFKTYSYDFVITLSPLKNESFSCKNYLALFDPVHHFFKTNGFLKKEYQNYDGYLLTYSPNSIIPNDFNGLNPRPYLLWYPTVQDHDYVQVDPTHLFYLCCPWGDRYNEKFHHVLSFLNFEPFTHLYGGSQFQILYPESYQCFIPYDANTLLETAAQNGIVLIFHSLDHNFFGIPSGRIFEAAAASTVIISDQNSFVQEHFQDAVLYVDTSQDAFSIYTQIREHVQWILGNKKEALEKAKKAYTIYHEHFLLENQLLTLEKFHEDLCHIP